MSASLTTRAAIASVFTAAFLLGLKGVAAWQTGSVAMLGSLADTALDLIASLVTLLAVRVAAQPADADHRFGHGKAEALAALVQVGLITFSALMIFWQAVRRLIEGDRTTDAGFGILVSILAVAATLGLLAYQRSVIRSTGSVAIEADHLHYQSDLLLNLAVIAALVLDQLAGLAGADPLFGIAIALWLAWGAYGASSRAIDQLMDKEWPEEKRRRLLEVAARHPELRGLHDLRTRTSGAMDFVQFHIWVDGALSVREAHEIVERMERRIEEEFPACEVLIHLDPEGQIDRPGDDLRETDLISGGRK